MKKVERVHIDPSSLFVAHACHELGNQALEILKQYGARIKVIDGGDPAITADSVVFIKLTVGEFKGSFLRIHPTAPVLRDDIERQRFLEINMPWALAGRVIFINPIYAKHGGRFGGKPLAGFTMALSQLAGHKDFAAKERRRERWKTWVEMRTGRVREGMRA